MAQILVIKAETARDGLQYIGDIVAVFPDDHIFSATEIAKFSILTIGGSVTDVQTRLDQIKPRIETAYLLPSDNKYHWDDGEETAISIINVYQLDNKWFKVENKFKFPITIDSLSPEEKQLLETIDINHPSVDSFINKIVKDITVLSDNDVEIKELRNTELN